MTYDQFSREPGSPEARAGRGRETDKSDESELFQRRLEWFRTYHATPSGVGTDLRFLQAVEQRSVLESLPSVRTLDPGGTRPEEGYAVVETASEAAVSVTATDNPVPNSSLGFVGNPVLVEFSEDEFPEGVDVKVDLEPAVAADVDLSTVRVFRFDDDREAWVLVPRSGVAVAVGYAWVRAHRPGRYVAAGLPQDPRLAFAINTLRAVQTTPPGTPSVSAEDRVLAAIGQLADAYRPAGAYPEDEGDRGRQPTATARPGAGLDGGQLRARLEGLDLRPERLPEWQILDDIEEENHEGRVQPASPFRAAGARAPDPAWSSFGPLNVNGRIKSLAVHPTDANTVWAGAANGGVWVSRDGGGSWSAQMSQQATLAIGALAVAPSNPNVLYAATGEDTPGWEPSWPGTGVYKSVDGGTSWPLLSNIPSKRCNRVLIHPANPDVVYVAGEAGLHKSVDGGLTWKDVRKDHLSDAVLDPLNPNRLFAAVWSSGVYRSLDAGATWELLKNGIATGSAAGWIKLTMGLKGGASRTNFLVAKMGTQSGDIYLSTTGGNLWHKMATGIQPASYNEWTNMVAVDPTDHRTVVAGGVGLSRSTDSGQTFTGVSGTHSDHHVAVFCPSAPNVVYLATDGGVYRSQDRGATWTLRSFGLVATQLYAIGVSQQTATFRLGATTQDQGIIRSGGWIATMWFDTGAGNEGGVFVVDPDDPSTMYCTPWDHKLRRSTDSGSTWATILKGLGDVTVNHLAVRRGNNRNLLCAVGNKIFASGNRGDSWSEVASLSGTVNRIVYFSASVVYAVTSLGRVYISTEAGAKDSWGERAAAADRPPFGPIAAVATDLMNSARLFIGYGSFGIAHVWRSTDAGAHWTNASGAGWAALPDIPVNDLVVDHWNADAVYAATDIGVFRTTDAGASWANFNQGMPRTFVSGLAYRPATRELYASTMGRGVFMRKV